jgi:hypothetical protein
MIIPRVARVFRVGLVDTSGIACQRCGQPVGPKDVEREHGVVHAFRAVCPDCHTDLFHIELERNEDDPESDSEDKEVEAPNSERRRLPNKRASEFVDIEALGFKFTASVSRYSTGDIGEVFIDPEKVGSTLNSLVHEIAVAFSFAVQHGANAADIQRALDRDSQDRPIGPLAVALDKL